MSAETVISVLGPEKISLTFHDVLRTYKSQEHGLTALGKYEHWFPLTLSPRLAGIVADLTGDGHLQGEPKWRIDYCSKNTAELERFNQEIFSIFGITGRVRDCKTNIYKTWNLGINNKPLARVLKIIGVPVGAKVLAGFSIPSWILSDRLCFASYVNRLFCCEGTVDLKSRYIELAMSKSIDHIDSGMNYFRQIKDCLSEYYGIESTNPFLETRENIRKDGIRSKAVHLKIKKKESLILFQEHIGFGDNEKSMRLKSIIRF